jgi:hypothetical protein
MNCETGNRAKGRKISEVEIIILVWIIVEKSPVLEGQRGHLTRYSVQI